jgi:hypothetical protein
MFGVVMEKSLKRPVLKVLENVWSCHEKVIEETCTKSP